MPVIYLANQIYVLQCSLTDQSRSVVFRDHRSKEETPLSFEMRRFFHRDVCAALVQLFQIEHQYDSYNEEEFCSDAWKQPIICRPK